MNDTNARAAVPAPPPQSRRDAAAGRRHRQLANLRHTRLCGKWLIVFNLLFWPSDWILFHNRPERLHAFTSARIAVTVVAILLLGALRIFAALRFRPVLAGGLAACLGVGSMCYFIGDLGGPDTPWFHFMYLFLLLPICLWVTPRVRLLGTLLLGLAMAVGYFLGHPRYLFSDLTLPTLGFLSFAVGVSVVVGLYADGLREHALLLQRHLTHRVEEQTVELRALAGHLERAQEHERARIARELHDELGQELTALRLMLRATRARFTQDPTAIGSNLEQLTHLTTRATSTTRNLLTGLHPLVLQDQGLTPALEWLAARAEQAGVRCTVTAQSPTLRLSPEVEAAAFRVVQEALTNVLRHACATQVDIQLDHRDGVVEVSIADDGVGLPEGGPRAGMGLVGMRERTRALGGDFSIEGAAGQGTKVRLRLEARAAVVAP